MNEEINIFSNLKEMLENASAKYADRPVFYLEGEDLENSKRMTYKEMKQEVDALGTALIKMGLKNKKIALISENRKEWEIAYLAVACGTGIVVPLDKSLPQNEIESSIVRSEVEAIFYSKKYEKIMEEIQKKGISQIKYFICMDLNKQDFSIYSQKEITEKGKELIEQGNRDFLDAKINSEEMSIMLFTSGTTNMSKIVMLSQKNICTNIMDISRCFDICKIDRMLSFLPLHHTFECTVGFLYPVSVGCAIVFSKGVRHIANELKNYKITAMISVPILFEKMYGQLLKKVEEKGMLDKVKKGMKIASLLGKVGIDVKKKLFKEIHESLGGELRLMVAGGAALDPNVEKGYLDLGFNLAQGYGLTETSPVISAEFNKKRKKGSIGEKMPSVQVKIDEPDENGAGELLVKGNSVMLGYYKNDEANKESFTEDGWFRTGDLAKIDKDGYIFLSGRKKFVIVLKNGKNVYPEELEALINKSNLVTESMVYGMPDDDGDVTISVKVVYNKEYIKENYPDATMQEIHDMIWQEIKVINKTMPTYKYVKKLMVTDKEMAKTTTLKIKRRVEMQEILNNK